MTIAAADSPSLVHPGPGIHLDVPNDDYRAWPLVCNSDLTVMSQWSPMHMKYHREHPKEPTPALIFGSALHLAVLEREKFEETYMIAEQCGAVVKSSGQRCRNDGIIFNGGGWVCGVHGKGLADQSNGKKCITAGDKAAIDNICRAISFHPAANGLLTSDGDNEVSAIFEDKGTSLPCKMRADGIRRDFDCVIDVKTTDCANAEDFARSITDYGYHRQAAFYLDGLRSLGIEVNHFAFIVVEKSAPYGVAVYRLFDDAIDAGREELRDLLKLYKLCEANRHWPGYDSEFQDISVPDWWMRKFFKKQQEKH